MEMALGGMYWEREKYLNDLYLPQFLVKVEMVWNV